MNKIHGYKGFIQPAVNDSAANEHIKEIAEAVRVEELGLGVSGVSFSRRSRSPNPGMSDFSLRNQQLLIRRIIDKHPQPISKVTIRDVSPSQRAAFFGLNSTNLESRRSSQQFNPTANSNKTCYSFTTTPKSPFLEMSYDQVRKATFGK